MKNFADMLARLLRKLKDSGHIQVKSSHAYGSLIRGYGYVQDISGAWETWKELRMRRVELTSITVGCMVEAVVQNGDPEGLTEAFDAWKGRCKIFGHFLPVGFVCGIDLVAGRWCPGVKSDGQMRGFFALKNGKDRIRKTVQSGAVYPFRGIDGTCLLYTSPSPRDRG